MAKITINNYPSGPTQFKIAFDYLSRTFVVVTLVRTSNQALNKVLTPNKDYRFLNPTTIEVLVSQTGFDVVQVRRQTATDLVVAFRDGSVLTASDLTNAELQAIHIAEEGRDQTADLAKEYADAAGSSAGNAKGSEDEARRIATSIREAGLLGYFTRRSFEKGFNVTTWSEVLLWEEDGNYYRWDGTLPKNVPAGSTPETSGGIGLGAWVSVGDAALRSLFAGKDGKGLDNFFGGGEWTGVDAPFWNFYSNPAEPIVNAMRQRFSIPTTDKQDPILWIEKKSSVTRDDGVSRWDSGAIFAALIKEKGSAYATALTGAVKYDGGSGDAIAVHGRVQVSAEGGQSFAGWFLNAAYAANQGRVVGIECDARSYLDQLEWRGAGGKGQYTVINVTSGGGTYGVHEYIRVPGKPSGSKQRAWTGILFGQNTIHPTDENGNGEAIRIRGSSSVNERYGGIAIGDADAANHYMTYGFKTLNANFTSNNAVQLAVGHRIVWGDSLGSGTGRWIEMLSSENLFNLQNSSLSMNGVKVLSGRQTGIFQLTGTADGTTKNTETVTLQELARYVKKVTDALITHGMIGPA